MGSLTKVVIAGSMIAALAAAAVRAPAMDGADVIKDRAAVMKQQAKNLGRVKAYFTGKGDQVGGGRRRYRSDPHDRENPGPVPAGIGRGEPRGQIRAKARNLEPVGQVPRRPKERVGKGRGAARGGRARRQG